MAILALGPSGELPLDHLEGLRVDDCLVVVLHVVLWDLTLIGSHLLGQKVLAEGLLQQGIAFVLLVRQDALDGGLAPLAFACRCRDAFVGQRLGDAVRRHPFEKHAVDALDHLGLLRVDHQIPVLASAVAEEPFERNRDLTVCKAFSLAPCAVLGNGPAFFLREARHDGQQDFSLTVEGPDAFLLKIDLDAVFLKPYDTFGKAEITERIQLLVKLVGMVWNPEMFDTKN